MENDTAEGAEARVARTLRSLLDEGCRRATKVRGERPRVLAAVSGGADSVFLLAILRRLSESVGFDLSAVTVNHRVRPEAESSGDADFVVALCASLTPPVPCSRVDLPSGAVARLAAERGRGIEDAARALRYRELESAAEACRADFVATGHTRNDRLETILMRALQGSGGASLAGIQPKRGRYIRPLIEIEREEIVSWLGREGYAWREDVTNADDRYFRNRVRSRLVPVLDEAFPGWKTGIIALSEKALLDEAVCRTFEVPEWSREGDGFVCDATRFDALPDAVRLRHVRDGLSLLGVTTRISFRHLARMIAPVGNSETAGRDGQTGNAGTRGARAIGAGVRLERAGGRLFLGPDIVYTHKSGYLVYVRECGRYSMPFGTVDVTPANGGVSLNGSFGPFPLPLLIRSRVGADAIGTGVGHKTVKKLLNEWAVSGSIRDMIPIIECGGAVRAVYGAPFGYPDARDGL